MEKSRCCPGLRINRDFKSEIKAETCFCVFYHNKKNFFKLRKD